MASYIRYNYMGAPLIDWNIEEMTGYKPKTTFYTDFGIAERFGEDAIRDTFNSAMKYWMDDIKYATEVVMVLNWKIWEHYHGNNDRLANLYDELWEKAKNVVMKKYKNNKEAMSYYWRTTD